MTNKIFSDEFKNLYSLSKTLRFSLIPYKETKEILEVESETKENFQNDRKIAENYKEMKKILDELHQEFIQDAMEDFSFDEKELKDFEEKYLEFLNFKDKDNYKEKQKLKNKYEDEAKKLAGKISKYFDKHKFEKYDHGITKKIILSDKVLEVLKEKYKDDKEKLEVINTFNKFFTYLSGFNQNRENFYKGEMKSGQFATRTIENLIQFIKNKKLFDEFYKDKYQEIGIPEEYTKIFDLNYFNNLFLQEGIDEYNGILGAQKGKANDRNDGWNQKINLYRQKIKGKEKNKYSLFKELYKQIGSIKKENDVYFEIKNDEELVKELNNFPYKVDGVLNEVREFYNKFIPKILNEEVDLEKVYLPKTIGTYFSHLVFSDWSKLAYVYNKKWKNEDLKIKEGEEINVQYRSLAELKERFKEIFEKNDELKHKTFWKRIWEKISNKNPEKDEVEKNWIYFWETILEHINQTFEGGKKEVRIDDEIQEEEFGSLKELEEKYFEAVKKYEEKMVKSDEGLSDDEEREIKENLKNYLDRVKEIERIGKYFDLKKHFEDIDEQNKDPEFYFEYNNFLTDLYNSEINKKYNEFRNYLTKNNIVEEKIKLNFGNGQLLSGWDLNKEKEKLSLIFRNKKEGKYYLGIINQEKNKKIFDKKTHPEIFVDNSDWEKMEYKLFPSPSKMIPKISFSEKAKSGEENIGWNEEIQKIKDEFAEFQEKKKNNKDSWGEEFDRGKLNKLIDYYKQVLERHSEKYVETFNLKFKPTNEYKNLGEFNDDVARQNYAVKFLAIDEIYLNQKVKNGELYLFEIHNKDWNDGSNGKKNLQTIYFEELFSEENLKNPVFKLSGEAEIFFRDALEKKRRKYKDEEKNILDKPRFSRNTILFHLPIELNYGKKIKENFNKKVNDFIKENYQDVKILGIDRGEKHLLYYSLIDLDGNIIESESLNKIKIGDKEVDFHEKLDELERERQKSRKSWQKIDQIKNLKKGYLSHVVKKIADLAVENNAIIVLEDLNFGFKSFRQKIEKNVYQQFEKALIDKLNFLVDKDKENQREALQLTAPFESFKKMGKQTGIIYYVLAANTSKVCPVCQWKKNIFPHYNGKDTIKQLMEKYKMKMFFENENDRFRIEYKGEGDKEIEKIYSDVDRIRFDKTKNNNKGGYLIYLNDNKKNIDENKYYEGSITELLKEFLENNNIDLNKEILKQLNEKVENIGVHGKKSYSKAYNYFLYLLNLILNIRNSINDKENPQDYIQCPACHFDTRKENELGIKDGDDNGAYNIALRGRFLIERIKNTEEGKKLKLAFSNNDYFQWVKEWKQNNKD